MQFSQPYENPALREAIGPALRPGGLDLTERAARYCGLAAGDLLLDVGCGIGATAAFLKDRLLARPVGLDHSPRLLADARRHRPDLVLVRGEATSLPVASDKFTAVFCECVLSLVGDPREALVEFFRVLRPGGYLVVADLYRQSRGATNMDPRPDARGCLKGMMPRERLEGRLHAAGLEICLWEDHSEHLKVLAAKLAWHGLRTQDLWGVACMPGGDPQERPGYGLLVARKRSAKDG